MSETVSEDSRQPGVMLAFFDIPEELDAEFNDWYNREHIPEKVGAVPGFVRARRFKSLDGRPNYLALYELEDVAVLEDPAYLGNYRGATEATKTMKAKAKTFFRAVYVQIHDAAGISLDDSDVVSGHQVQP